MSRIDLDAELDALDAMTLNELRSVWTRQMKSSAPKASAGLMRLALAHALQSKALGGVTKKMDRRLRELAGGAASVAPSTGTGLAREWQGKLHVVTVTDDQRYSWNGRDWNSLSEVARAITGTRWSGPAFFGLKQKRRAA